MIRKLLACAGLLLSLQACAGPPPPTYGDAFKGLHNGSAAAVPANVPVTMRPPVGLILSENVDAYIGFVKDNNDYWGRVVPASLTNQVALADNDPRYFAGRLLAMLKARFPSTVRVNDFNEAVSKGMKSVVLIDFRITPGAPYGDRTTRADIDAYFFDSAMQPVSKLSGHGEYKVPYASADGGAQRVIDQALQELEGKMSTLVR